MTDVVPTPRPHRVTPDQMVRRLTRLSAAPRVLPRLKKLLSDGNSSLDEIVAMIRLDPALSARVLQVGNSTYFSRQARCFGVADAVHRVGFDHVYELVSYAVASEVLIHPLRAYAMEADEIWRLSVSCALAAEALACRAGVDREVAYTAGLLHGVGMVAMNSWLQASSPEIVLRRRSLPDEATADECAAVGFTQADAGAALLDYWQFPHEIGEPVRRQYAPVACATHTRLACLLHCAKWVRTVVCHPDAPRPPVPWDAALHLIPVRVSELPAIIADTTARLTQIGTLLDVGPPDFRRPSLAA